MVVQAALILGIVAGMGPSAAPLSTAPRFEQSENLQDDEWGNANDGLGFESVSQEEIREYAPAQSEARWSLVGGLHSSWGFWLERRADPLSKARQGLELDLTYRGEGWRLQASGHAEFDFAYSFSREQYDSATISAYESTVDSREVLGSVTLGDLELTLGRQIVVWGEGMVLSPIDVVNPRDSREPGLVTLRDLRLPLLCLRVGWFLGSHRFELLVTAESEWGYRPPPGAVFSPLRKLIHTPELAPLVVEREVLYAHQQPRFAAGQQELFARWQYSGDAIDLSLYFASLLDRAGVLGIDGDTFLATPHVMTLEVEHLRHTVFGASGAYPVGHFSVRFESTVELGRSVNVGTATQLGTEKVDTVNLMLGFEYSGMENVQVLMEAQKSILAEKPDGLLFDMTPTVLALNIRALILRERLGVQLTGMLFGLGAEASWLAKLSCDYKMTDNWSLGLSAITYQPGPELGPLYGFDTHDQVLLETSWDFQIL